MSDELKTLVQEYRDGELSRRGFVARTLGLAGMAVLAACAARTGDGASGGDQTAASNVEFKGKAGRLVGYLARPAAGQNPAIVIIHANQGLNDYTRDVARRLAREGYVALAVDFLSRRGGTAAVNPKGEGLSNIRELAPWQQVAEDGTAAFDYLKTQPFVRGDRLGLMGFCWGGEMTFSSATEVRGLSAVVVFYGRSPQPLDRVKTIEAPVLAHYGEKDPGVNQDIPGTVTAMGKYNKPYSYKIYPGAQHGFHTDTNPERYHAEAAREAWSWTLDFFKTNLRRA